MKHIRSPFGALQDGTQIDAHTLKNDRGMSATILTWGGILHDLVVPDASGRPVHVAFGHSTLDAYCAGVPYTGAVIGRVANRIANAQFTLGGVVHRLEKNAGSLNIHSGSGRYGWRVFHARDSSDDGCAAVTLHLLDSGEGGMPGTVDFSVRFAVDNENRLTLSYQARPTCLTPISVTHHAYFNLGGTDAPDILDHLFEIDADAYLPIDSAGLPTGEIHAVAGTRFDFRRQSPLAAHLTQDGRGFDHNFCIRDGGMRPAASAFCPRTGIRMQVETDLPGIQFFTPARAFCLETQHYPNAVNTPRFPSCLYGPDAPFVSSTAFRLDHPAIRRAF